jgi:hypothetical protein
MNQIHQVVWNALCPGKSSRCYGSGPIGMSVRPQFLALLVQLGRIQSWANPCSLAATRGVSIDFYSSAD